MVHLGAFCEFREPQWLDRSLSLSQFVFDTCTPITKKEQIFCKGLGYEATFLAKEQVTRSWIQGPSQVVGLTKMVEEVRICLLKGLGGTIGFDKKLLAGTNSPPPKYTGLLSKAANLFIYSIFGEDRLNYTTVLKKSIGIFNASSGYYDEDSCLYSMQTNQSDFGLAWPWYPVQGKNLKSFSLYRADKVKMLSRYEVMTQTYDSDVMGVFAYAFTPGVWLTVALSCFIFWLMIKTHVRMRNKMDTSQTTRDDSLYEVLTHLFQVETIDYTGASMKVVSLFASVLSFVVIVYFTCSMKTDIVVVQDPDLINNYDDLLTKPNIRLMFSSLSDTLSKFESADPQSKERQAFERSLKFVKGDRSEMIIHPAGMNMLQASDSLQEVALEKSRRTVAPILSSQIKVITNFVCYLKVLLSQSGDAALKQSMNYYSWTSEDPNAREDLLTSVYSAFYKSPYLERIQKRMKWIVAMGFNSMWDKFHDILIINGKINNREEGDIFRNCLSDDYRENLPQVKLAPFAPVQFKALTITCGVLLVLSVVAIVRERYNKRVKHPKFGHNKVAVAGPGGVADQENQTEQSDQNDAPLGNVVIAIEAVEQEERQDILNVQVESVVEVVPPVESSNKKSNTQQVELPPNTTAEPSAMLSRPDQSEQSSWKNVPLEQEEAIEVFNREGRQGTSNGQSRAGVASSIDFSSRRGVINVEMWRKIRSMDQPVKWKVTPL